MKNLFAFVILIFLALSCNNSDSEKNTNWFSKGRTLGELSEKEKNREKAKNTKKQQNCTKEY